MDARLAACLGSGGLGPEFGGGIDGGGEVVGIPLARGGQFGLETRGGVERFAWVAFAESGVGQEAEELGSIAFGQVPNTGQGGTGLGGLALGELARGERKAGFEVGRIGLDQLAGGQFGGGQSGVFAGRHTEEAEDGRA